MPGDGRFGLGIVLGIPTAITGKYWIGRRDAIDFGIAFSPYYSTLIYGDYLWHFIQGFGARSKFSANLNPYVGVGAGIYAWNSGPYRDRPGRFRDYDVGTGVYVRVPFGAEWFPGEPPLGVFADITPGIAVVPGAWLLIDFGIGIRYYF